MRVPLLTRTASPGRRGIAPRGAWLLALAALSTGCAARVLLEVTPIVWAKNVRVYLGGGGNSAALLQREEALLVDPKFLGFAIGVRRALQVELGRRVQRIVLTHHHPDHAGGLDLYPDTGAVIAHPRTRARVEAGFTAEQRARRIPWAEVPSEIHLLLEGEEVVVKYLGAGHTDGDLVALLPAHRLLVAGDLFLTGFEPRIDEASGGDILALRGTLERMLELDFETVVPGHGPLGKRADVERYRDYLGALEAAVREAVAEGKTEDQAAQAVTLESFADIRPLPLVTDRQTNVRKMFRAVRAAREAGKARP